jgi:hypothetical protein
VGGWGRRGLSSRRALRATSAGPALVQERKEKRERGREEGGGGGWREGGWRRGELEGDRDVTAALTTYIFRQSLAIHQLVDFFVVLTSPCLNTPLQLKLTLMKMSTTEFCVQIQIMLF